MDGVLGNFSFGIYSSVNTVFLNIFCEFFFQLWTTHSEICHKRTGVMHSFNRSILL